MKDQSNVTGAADLVFTAEMWESVKLMPTSSQWRILKQFFEHYFEGKPLQCKLYIDYARIINLEKNLPKKTKTEKEQNEESSPIPPKEEKKIKERKSSCNVRRTTPAGALTRKVDFEKDLPQAPTVWDVAQYIKQRGYTFRAERFCAYYASQGWRTLDKPIDDWRGLCDRWQERTAEFEERAERRREREQTLAQRKSWDEIAREEGRRSAAEIIRRFDEARANSITHDEYLRLLEEEKAQQRAASPSAAGNHIH